MKDFFLGSLSIFCFATACMVLLASANFVSANLDDDQKQVIFCSIPAGGCAQQLGGRCIGQCTDNNVGDGVACRCRPTVAGAPNPCYCEAYFSSIG